jgi:hypothetical protein
VFAEFETNLRRERQLNRQGEGRAIRNTLYIRS